TEFPHFQRAAEGVLYDVFCQREIVDSKDASQRRDHAAGFTPKQMMTWLHQRFSFITGRTSTAPSFSKIGQPFEISIGCSRSRAWMRLYPPTTSLASAKGPSIIIF